MDDPVERGIGCASVMPAAFIGVAGLADGAGPGGWLGFAELLGWAAVCGAAGVGVAALLREWRKGGLRRHAAIPAAMTAVVAFTYAPYWLGLYAPMAAKIVFTTSLQIAGSLTAGGLILWLTYLLWTGRRGY
jgi:hypothetical protein